MDDSYKSRDQYFATEPSERIAQCLMGKIDEWQTMLRASGHYQRLKKSYRQYYGLTKEGNVGSSEILRKGERNELATIQLNEYRNLIQHVLVMTTANRAAMECRAMNTDHESQSQTIIGDGILDYYMREKKIERYLKQAAETALWAGEGYVAMNWDTSLGDIYGMEPTTGKPVFSGDVDFYNPGPLDMIFDLWKKSPQMDWRIISMPTNKWNLIAKFPEFKDEILNADQTSYMNFKYGFFNYNFYESDDIPLFIFYHKKCEVLPEGRMVYFVSSNEALIDVPLPYKNMPVYRMSPSDMQDTPFGYTPAWDLLGPQDAYNMLHSTAVTNISTFGVQNVLVPEGGNINVLQLAGGLNAIKYNAKNGEIKPLQLTATSPEVYKYMDMLANRMQTYMAVNSVTRGQPDANIKSGSYAALVAAQALQFNSGLQQSYAQLLEDVGLGIIEMLQDYAKTDRIATIIGKNNAPLALSFKGSDVDQINRVVVDTANPVTKTTAGRVAIADNLLEKNMIEAPEQYIQVLTTGKLEPVYHGRQAENLLMQDENEQLRKGQVPPVVVTENHILHIHEHKSVLSNSAAKKSPHVVNAVLMHIQEHINQLRMADPQLLQVLGQQSLAPQLGMGPMEMPPGADNSGMSGGQLPQLQGMPQENMPGLPNPAKNPLNGEVPIAV